MNYNTKCQALIGCSVGMLVGLVITAAGGWMFSDENARFKGYAGCTEGVVTNAQLQYKRSWRELRTGKLVQEGPIYLTTATFDVAGRTYLVNDLREGSFTLSPKKGDRVHVVFRRDSPAEAKIRFREHLVSIFIIIFGLGCIALGLLPIRAIIRGGTFLGSQMPTHW